MEYLTPHIILRKGFIRGTVYPKLASHIAEFMAQTLFKTSDHVSLFDDEPSQAVLETERQRYLRQLFFDTVGFAGVKMIRRILGLAHVEDLESIKDSETRSRCEQNALRLGRELVVNAAQFGDLQEISELAARIRRDSQ